MSSPLRDNLQREAQAAKALLSQWRAVLGDDEQAKADMVEGETSLHEMVTAALRRLLEIETLKLGIDATIEILKARRERLTAQEAGLRKAMLDAMSDVNMKGIETPIATVSRKRVPPGLVIAHEDRVPKEFWKVPAPVLDRSGLLRALKEGHAVPGAALSNGSETISIRWS